MSTSSSNKSTFTIDKVFDEQCTDICAHKCILNYKDGPKSQQYIIKILSGKEIYSVNKKNGHKCPEHIIKNFETV